jgi:hypothetical protein
MSIFPKKQTSHTLNVKENWFAMVAMILEFIVIMFPMDSFEIYLHIDDVIRVGSKEVAPMDNMLKSFWEVMAKPWAKRWSYGY